MIESARFPVLSLEAATVRFGGVVAVNNVSLSIGSGPGISAIIGPNGAGKTTLFNVLTGVVRPNAGTLRIDNEDVTGARADQIFRRRISRTFQGIRLFEHLSIEQNLLLAARSVSSGMGSVGATILGWRQDAAEAKARVHQALESVGVARQLWGKGPGELSHLSKRLVEIARALTVQPKVLLLDEPAAGLNTSEKALISDAFRMLAESYNCRIVVVEHDMKLVMSVADHIWVMNFGALLRAGNPDEIQNDPAVIEAYLGTKPLLNN